MEICATEALEIKVIKDLWSDSVNYVALPKQALHQRYFQLFHWTTELVTV